MDISFGDIFVKHARMSESEFEICVGVGGGGFIG